MVRVPRVAVIALVAGFSLIAFGVGLATAAVAVTDCESACELHCAPDECDEFQAVGCGCAWYCSDGSQGSIVCG